MHQDVENTSSDRSESSNNENELAISKLLEVTVTWLEGICMMTPRRLGHTYLW